MVSSSCCGMAMKAAAANVVGSGVYPAPDILDTSGFNTPYNIQYYGYLSGFYSTP